MSLLDDLGLRMDWIYEVLVSTGREDAPHVTPIGIWTPDLQSVHMHLYGSSHTLRNALELGCLVVNFPPDEHLLSIALLSPDDLRFRPATAVDAPCLCSATATLELQVSSVRALSDYTHVAATVVSGEKSRDVRLINRAGPLLLESLILASRLSVLDRGATLKAIRESSRVVRKVAPGSRYDKAMDLLRATLGDS